MKQLKSLILSALCIASFGVTVHHVHAETAALSQTELAELIKNLQTQVAALQNQLQSNQTAEATEEVDEEEDEKPFVTLGYDGTYRDKYTVIRDLRIYSGNRMVEDDPQDHQIWNLFVDIAGEDFAARYIREFWVFDSEESSSAAFVKPVWKRNPTWVLAVNTHDIDIDNEADVHGLIETFIHEISHIEALSDLQANHNESEEACETYYAIFACLDKDAYQYEFIQKFWDTSALAYASTSMNMEDYYEKLDFVTEYYEKNANAFVSLYAASDFYEDFAESFTVFVLTDGTDKGYAGEDKVRFFDKYKALRQFREDIRKSRSAYLSDFYSSL